MQYYRLLTQETALCEHLRAPGVGQRYARSCRDISATIPQDLVALHAAIGSRALRSVLDDTTPRITIWCANPVSMEVRSITRAPDPAIMQKVGNWTICTDTRLEAELYAQREERLPNETGGVLIGSIDQQRKRIYVVLSISSPPDSVEWPTSYIRGCQGLTHHVQRINTITGGNLAYVGEWHSHPRGHQCTPSTTDRQALQQLAAMRSIDDLPALMAIITDSEVGWNIAQV